MGKKKKNKSWTLKIIYIIYIENVKKSNNKLKNI